MTHKLCQFTRMVIVPPQPTIDLFLSVTSIMCKTLEHILSTNTVPSFNFLCMDPQYDTAHDSSDFATSLNELMPSH